MYKEQTYETIKERVLENIDIGIDKREGSFINNMVSPLGVELAKTYMEFDNIFNIAFIKNNYGEYLDLKCKEWGIERKEGKKAIGEITFFGRDGYVVTNGIECKTKNGLLFVTSEEGVIVNGKVSLMAESVEEGVRYNVSCSTIINLSYDVNGVEEIRNETDFLGGIDKENDRELIERFYQKVRTPAISGNVYHYKEWATSIDGVKNARIIPLWDGPGTVKVIITDEHNRPIKKEIIKECSDYIESVRPIGAEVTVTTPSIVNVDIRLNVVLEADYSIDSIRALIKENIDIYLIKCSGEIIFTKVGCIISDVIGIKDYNSLTINGDTKNVNVSSDYSAQLNSLMVNGGN